MSPQDEELLTERITIRFTESEIREIRRVMKDDGMRKESAFIRRIIMLYLQKKGYAVGPADRFSGLTPTSAILNEETPFIPGSGKRSAISRK